MRQTASIKKFNKKIAAKLAMEFWVDLRNCINAEQSSILVVGVKCHYAFCYFINGNPLGQVRTAHRNIIFINTLPKKRSFSLIPWPNNISQGANSPHVFSSANVFVPRTQHGLHNHKCNGIWICPRCSLKGNSKLCKGQVVIDHSDLKSISRVRELREKEYYT